MGLILDGTTGISASGNITGGNIIVTNNFSPSAISVVGNVQGAYILGNGSQLTGLPAGYANSNAAAYFASGTVSTAIETTDIISATGNVTGSNVVALTAFVGSLTGTASVAVSASGTSATVTTAAQPNITSTGTLTSVTSSGLISTTGNIVGSYVLGNGSALSSLTGGNVTGTVANATYALSSGSAVGTAATVTTAAQPNITSVGTLTSLSVSGNITAPNVVLSGYVAATQGLQASSNYTGPYVDGLALDYVTGNGRISVGTSDGIIFYNGGVASTQLAALSSGGDFSATGNISGGNLSVGTGNIVGGGITISANTISTGNTTMYLDPLADSAGTGNVVILGNLDVRGTTTTINSNTVAINDLVFVVANNASSSAQADGGGLAVGPDPTHYAELTFNSAGNTWVSSIALSATGNIATGGTINATGNITAGNLKTGGLISSTGNITGGNVNGQILSGTTVSITGNITAGNISVTGSSQAVSYSASGNITGGNISVGIANITTANIGTLTVTGTEIDTGNITGGNLLTGGLVSATGNVYGISHLGTTVSMSGNITGGNLSVGVGNATIGNILTTVSAVGNIGSTALPFNTIFAKATSALYADLAEMYCADTNYVPGTVVEFGGIQEVQQTTSTHSTAVAGIVSTNPSYLMNATLACENSLEIALVGRVPCYVVGTIRKGDRLVSSDTPGVATRLDMTKYEPGCIVGKALEDYDSTEVGTIEVAVGRI